MKLFTLQLLLFSIFNSFIGFSQDQECVLHFKDGTTIEGYGMLKIVGTLDPKEKIKFRLTKKEKGEFWDFEDVSKITFIGFKMTRTFEYVKTSSISYPKLLEILVDGEVSIKGIDGTATTFTVHGGFLSVNKDRVSILSES